MSTQPTWALSLAIYELACLHSTCLYHDAHLHTPQAPQYLKYQCSLDMLNGALQLVNQAYGPDAANATGSNGSMEFTVSEESLLATIQQAAAKATGGAKTVKMLTLLCHSFFVFSCCCYCKSLFLLSFLSHSTFCFQKSIPNFCVVCFLPSKVVLGLSKLKRLHMDRAHSAVHLAMRLPSV